MPSTRSSMRTPEIVQRFIQLRAQGWTYSRLMAEFNVSKSTLTDWSRKHQFEIQNSQAIELKAPWEKWHSSTAEGVSAHGTPFEMDFGMEKVKKR